MPYSPGDCLAVEDGVEVVSCDRPHDYEVTLSADPPPTRADIEAVTLGECRGAVEDYLGGDGTASGSA